MLCYEQQSILFRERTKENSKKNVCIKQFKILKLWKGYFTFEDLTTNEIVNEWDARGEKGDLIGKLIESYDHPENILKYIVKDNEEYLLPDKIDHKYMIKLLNLRDYATKEDILNELKEILWKRKSLI